MTAPPGTSLAAAADHPDSAARTDGRAGRTGTLLILISDQRGAGGVSAAKPILGIPILRRVIVAGERAGFGRIKVCAPQSAAIELEGALAGTAAVFHRKGVSLPPGRLVVLQGNVLAGEVWLRGLLALDLEPNVLYVDGSAAAVIELAADGGAREAISRAAEPGATLAALSRAVETVPRELPEKGRFVVSGDGDFGDAEKWLLRSLIKDTEGFMSRHVERPISLAITRQLVTTNLRPNTITAISGAIGLVSATFFLSQRPGLQLTGALLFLTHSIVDGCDGELARLTFRESRWGGLFDFWTDNVVHAAVFACMAIGAHMTTGSNAPLIAGAVAIMGAAFSAFFIYWRTMRRKGGTEPLFTSVSQGRESRLSRSLDALTRRDFIYLIVAFSAFGKASWFLYLAAAGVPIFFFLLLLVARSEHGRATTEVE